MTFQLSLDEELTEERATDQFLLRENGKLYGGLFIGETYIGDYRAFFIGLGLIVRGVSR